MKQKVRIWQRKRFQLVLAVGFPMVVVGSFLVTVAAQEKVPLAQDQTEVASRGSGDSLGQPVSKVLPPSSRSVEAAAEVSFEVCTESQSWVRPSTAEQQQQLTTLPQYAAGFEQNSEQVFWTHDLFSFTDYGLSARIEPLYLTGLWSKIDTVWDCYDESRVSQINAGKTAEVWVLSHRVKQVQWQGDRYVMAVEPAQGFQFVQFPRLESQTTLPLEVVTIDGSALEVVASSLQ